jgi:glycosyltransferase involved in cell wall biosynthesis
MDKKVSVIIPFYNGVDWLCEAVQSVLDQTYKNFEIIVVNDGSPENDKIFLNQFGEKIIYIKTKNQGPAAARNLGIDKANGDYIAFLDSDDLWYPEKLAIQIKFMIEEKIEWCHTGYELFRDLDKETYKTINVSHFKGDVFFKCLVSSPIATPCVVIYKTFLKQHKEVRFSEQMRFGEDGFMWLNVALHKPLGVIEQPLTKVRMRGENAALRAKVHLQVKSQLWTFLKMKIKISKKIKTIPFIIKLAYWLSHFNFKVFKLVEKLKFNNSIVEILAKILYLPIYILLKVYKHKLNYHV